MIWFGIYLACVIVLVAIMMGFKSNLSKRQKFLTVALGPLTIIVLFVGVIVISIDHIIKHGFHDLLPKRKGNAHPLKADDFKYWPKDTILSGSDKMTIDEFNVKFNKNIRLDDVYGQAYESSLTPEEIFNCKSRIDGRIGVEPNMPDSEYKAIAIAFARAFVSGDYSTIQDKLSDKTYLTLYKRETFSGAKTIIEYFKTWKKKADDEKVWYKVDVAWNPNQCRPSVSVQIKGYNNMVIFFFMWLLLLLCIISAPVRREVLIDAALWKDRVTCRTITPARRMRRRPPWHPQNLPPGWHRPGPEHLRSWCHLPIP